ncbi:TIGR04219 family outer membrane beta-barrel protein [Marinomonas fungiae]|uniref:Outer membrane protein n=1 Tax=Marinomonas fungiae TaxID=1137284 RepID=A0A0K6IJ17_9GAMM|nr:TIGR04219 family outer membrane beta-barrel protein [Marinomonas fungiae]CUB03083.1 outer membrane protein [Marinomonas fungiae]
MKKALIASTLLLASTAQADVLGLTAEVGQFSPDVSFDGRLNDQNANVDFSGEDNTYYGIALEHPVPLIPNVRLQGSTLEGRSASVDMKVESTDYTLYYEILDGLAWIDLDLGISIRDMDIDARVNNSRDSESIVIPTGYLSAYFTIPTLPIQIGGEVKAISAGDSSMTDTTFKIKYQSPFIVGLEGGYRNANFDIDEGGIDSEIEFDGFFVGVFADF